LKIKGKRKKEKGKRKKEKGKSRSAAETPAERSECRGKKKTEQGEFAVGKRVLRARERPVIVACGCEQKVGA